MPLTTVPTAPHAAPWARPSSSPATASPPASAFLVGQRIRGLVAVIDIPAGPNGRVYLVERSVACLAEAEGPVAEYCARSEAAGMPAVLVSRRILHEEDAA